MTNLSCGSYHAGWSPSFFSHVETVLSTSLVSRLYSQRVRFSIRTKWKQNADFKSSRVAVESSLTLTGLATNALNPQIAVLLHALNLVQDTL